MILFWWVIWLEPTRLKVAMVSTFICAIGSCYYLLKKFRDNLLVKFWTVGSHFQPDVWLRVSHFKSNSSDHYEPYNLLTFKIKSSDVPTIIGVDVWPMRFQFFWMSDDSAALIYPYTARYWVHSVCVWLLLFFYCCFSLFHGHSLFLSSSTANGCEEGNWQWTWAYELLDPQFPLQSEGK